ncbi:MAG: hypothetical protein Q7S92_00575, partial [Candidatus Diapherotrites archaeon]|nr:hypothetical protein [Candidatus Diapherotrites archaeon]
VKTEEDCYKIMNAIHEMFVYLSHKVKDYIEAPKENGYQSLHTTFCFENCLVELQIRTQKMDWEANHGIAQYRPEKQNEKSNGNTTLNGFHVSAQVFTAQAKTGKNLPNFFTKTI